MLVEKPRRKKIEYYETFDTGRRSQFKLVKLLDKENDTGLETIFRTHREGRHSNWHANLVIGVDKLSPSTPRTPSFLFDHAHLPADICHHEFVCKVMKRLEDQRFRKAP